MESCQSRGCPAYPTISASAVCLVRSRNSGIPTASCLCCPWPPVQVHLGWVVLGWARLGWPGHAAARLHVLSIGTHVPLRPSWTIRPSILLWPPVSPSHNAAVAVAEYMHAGRQVQAGIAASIRGGLEGGCLPETVGVPVASHTPSQRGSSSKHAAHASTREEHRPPCAG